MGLTFEQTRGRTNERADDDTGHHSDLEKANGFAG